MATIFSDMRDKFYALAVAAIPAINEQVDSLEAGRFSWRDRVQQWQDDNSNGNGLQLPYLAVEFAPAVPLEFGVATRVWGVAVKCYYVTAITGNTEQYMAEMESAALALIQAMYGNFDEFQLAEHPSFDMGINNEVNQDMEGQGIDVIGVVIDIKLLVGEEIPAP